MGHSESGAPVAGPAARQAPAGGPARASGKIAVGDELLSVNGQVVLGRSLEAINFLQNTNLYSVGKTVAYSL